MSLAKLQRRRLRIALVLGFLLVTGGLIWLSNVVLQAETATLHEQATDEQRGKMRLALWRLDGWMGGFLAREAARPTSDYQSPGSPLADFHSDFIRLHFRVNATSRPGTFESAGKDQPTVLAQLSERLTVADLKQRLEEAESVMAEHEDIKTWVPDLSRRAAAGAQCLEPGEEAPSLEIAPGTGPLLDVAAGPLVPLWLDWHDQEKTFVFVRRVATYDGPSYEGFLGHWPALEQSLLRQIEDLFPIARLEPWLDGPANEALLLASLPATLQVPSPPSQAATLWTPSRLKLGLVWVIAILAGLAVTSTLRASLDLSERRQRFAQAMAHELRTPLTTFRMYTEMLADGTIRGEKDRQEYLDMLHAESKRLSGLVENVLNYAGFEEKSSPGRRQRMTLTAALESILPPLRQQATNAGLTLEVRNTVPNETPILIDLQLVAGLLTNLVDNACKYASDSPKLELEVATAGNDLLLRLRDYGPGLPLAERAKIFEPFKRGSTSTAAEAPNGNPRGIGLGLALARRMARASGGDLTLLAPAGPGACFELRLPST